MSEITERIALVEPHPSVAKRNTAKTGVAPRIRKLKLKHPELSHSDIARRVGCRPSNVTAVLKTFLGKHSEEQLRSFQDSKADVYDALQHRLLLSLTPAKLAKARVQEAVTSAAILEDKARLVRGQATAINMTAVVDLIEAMRAEPRPTIIDATKNQ